MLGIELEKLINEKKYPILIKLVGFKYPLRITEKQTVETHHKDYFKITGDDGVMIINQKDIVFITNKDDAIEQIIQLQTE